MRSFAISMDSDPEEKEDSAFMIVDFTPYQEPSLVGRVPCQGFYRDLAKVGSRLVCLGNTALDIYEIGRFPEVRLLQQFEDHGGKRLQVDVRRDLVYVLNEVQGVGIVDIARSRGPSLLSCVCPNNLSQELILSDIALHGNLLLLLVNDLDISNNRECLMVYDVTTPDRPALKKHLSISPCKGNALATRQDSIFIAGFRSFLTKNIRDLNANEEATFIERQARRGFALLVDADFAYLIEEKFVLVSTSATLEIIDITEASKPQFMGNHILAVDFLSDNQDVSMRKLGKRLVFVSTFGLRIIDVSDPADPEITHLFRPSDRFRITSGLEILTVPE